jgi:YegS/Rv2252/BmrU family lipid kinase
VGGDGTVNEVVNGIYGSGNIREVVLGIISTGTGSDYIRTVGLPRPFQEMCRCVVKPRRMEVDVGVVEYARGSGAEQRLFVNFAGTGFDAEIVRRTTRQYKALGGMASYLAGLFTTLLCYRNRPVTLVIDGEVVKRKVCAVIMNNGRYGGGGMHTAPDADLTDGYLDALVIGDLNRADLLWSLPRIYRGTHLNHPLVELCKAKQIELYAEDRLSLQADGELLGQVPARFRIMPGALSVGV